MGERFYSVFVGHINPETRRHELKDLFEKCGNVADVFVVQNERPGAFAYGFVRYYTLEACERAIREINRWEVGGNRLNVQLAKDTQMKVKSEKEAEERSIARRANIERRPNNRSSNNVEDTMFLARVKESCTTISLKNGADTINHLMEDIGRSDAKRCATQWGPLAEPVTGFDHVTKKLISRCHESGDGRRLIGAKKSQEFIASLKTIMQEIEDFLCHTAGNVTSTNQRTVECDNEETMTETDSAETNSNELSRERDEDEIKTSRTSVECVEPKLVEDQKDISDEMNDDRHVMLEAVSSSGSVNKEFRIDSIVDVDSSKQLPDSDISDNEKSVKYTALKPKYSEEIRDGCSPAGRKLKQYLDAMGKDQSSDGSKTVTRGSSVTNLSQAEQEVTDDLKTFLVENDINVNEENQKFRDIVNWAKSVDKEIQMPTAECPISEAGLCYCHATKVREFQEKKDVEYEHVVKSKVGTGNTDQRERQKNSTTSEKCSESLRLEALFAKLPPVSSIQRTNSQDSSLSEDSGEGVDDSGVESDFLLRSNSEHSYNRHILMEQSQKLKSMLGIGSNARFSQVVQERGGNVGTGQVLRNFKERLIKESPKKESSGQTMTSRSTNPTDPSINKSIFIGRGRGFQFNQ